MSLPPVGFQQHFRRSAVTDPWEPLLSRRIDDRVELGVVLAPAHCNSRGFAHGGVIATLADNSMGLSYVEARLGSGNGIVGAVTVSLSLDYVSQAQLGQWLQVTPRVIRGGSTTGFVDALITADTEVVARASAVFRAVLNAAPLT